MARGDPRRHVLDDGGTRGWFAFAGTVLLHGLLATIIVLSQFWIIPPPPPAAGMPRSTGRAVPGSRNRDGCRIYRERPHC